MWVSAAGRVTGLCEILRDNLSALAADADRQTVFPSTPPLHWQEKNSDRKGKMELPEAGKVTPVDVRVSGGRGAGRFGRVSVCGTTAGAINGKSPAQKESEKQGRITGKVVSEV